MIDLIRVTPENVSLFSSVLTTLKQRRNELAAALRRHPVECVFGEVRLVLTNSRDLDRLISKLDDELGQCEDFLLADQARSRSVRSSEPVF